MSSLAASRADGYYFPPEWRPEFGGLSKYVGSKGANQYQKYGILRFELPFDGWCLKCQHHMSKLYISPFFISFSIILFIYFIYLFI